MPGIHQPQFLQSRAVLQFPERTMTNSPDHYEFTSYFSIPTNDQGGGSTTPRSDHLHVPEHKPPSSRTPSPTQYEFIMTTGDESASSARQKLKTVRSHVMKNYLHHQQQQQQQCQGGPSGQTLSRAGSERRKAKQRTRSSRSASRETDHGSMTVEGGIPGIEIGALFAGASFTEPVARHNANPYSTSLGEWDSTAARSGVEASRFGFSMLASG